MVYTELQFLRKPANQVWRINLIWEKNESQNIRVLTLKHEFDAQT